MNVAPVAITWAVAGLIAAVALPRVHRRRLAAAVPLAAAVAALLSLGGGADQASALATGDLSLGRPGAGMVLLGAVAATVCLVLGPPQDSGGIVALAGCGSLAAVALATGSPLVFGVCFVAAFALLGVRVVAAVPSRVSLAAARVAPLGAASFLAVAVFLPVDVTSVPPRAHLAGGLLAGGFAAGLALVPLGGWASGLSRLVRSGALLAPWVLLLLPTLVLTAQPLQLLLPPGARTVFGFVLLPAGGLTAAWEGLRALGAADAERYVRVLLADMGLVAMGLATPQAGARLGSLLLVVAHLCVAPLLLHDPGSASPRPRRLAWLALSGIPPGPAFWGRFAIMAALATAFGGGPLIVAVPATGAAAVVAVRAVMAARPVTPARHPGRAAGIAAWFPPLAAVTVGLLPVVSLRALLGVG